MTGYVRQKNLEIQNGNVIDADDHAAEYNQVESAFNSSTGHVHDGSIGEGAPITKVGPVQDLEITANALQPKTNNTLDLGTASFKFKDGRFQGTLTVDGGVTGALTGNASTATVLQTARTINGTSFNGSANITTANWGTSRNITIGGTTKSVNGSSNVSWSLGEIGVNNNTLTLATSGIATGSRTWTANQGSNATFTVNVPGTNLGSSGSGTTRTITSSTGSNTSITFTASDLSAVPTSRTLTAGSGLSGGGTLASNRTFSVDSTVVRTSGNQTIAGTKTFNDGTNTTVNIVSADSGESVLRLYGSSQGTGRIFVGQSQTYGGGIEYNGDGNPPYSGAGSDFTTLYRVNSGSPYWTAKNSSSDNIWEFRDSIILGSQATTTTHAVRADRTLTTGDGLSGGGDLTANRTISVDSSVVRTSRTITTGTGLSGGGSLNSDLTLTVSTAVMLSGSDQTMVGNKAFTTGVFTGTAWGSSGDFTTNSSLKARTSQTGTPGDVAAEFLTNNTGVRTALVLSNPDGQVGSISTSGSATSFNTSSDYRRKTVDGPVLDAAARVLALNPIRYRWNVDLDAPAEDGFLAHETQAVVPNAVQGEKDAVDPETGNPEYQMMDHSKLVPLLTAALQNALRRIEELEAKVGS